MGSACPVGASGAGDPPREGMHKKVISQIMNIKPEKIVYISCNSATQARDIAILKELYDIEFIPVSYTHLRAHET